MSSPEDPRDPRAPGDIVVLGAGGVVGGRIVAALVAAGARVAVAGRRAPVCAGIPPHRVHVADASDPGSLGRAFAGARVVVNAAGPLRTSASPVLVAALAAGAHYVDVGGEQAVLQEIYERHESAVRKSGLVALPGAGLDCMIGDLAGAWAAAHLIGETGDGDEIDAGAPVRDRPSPRLAEDQPLDELAISYVFDDPVVSAGLQRALFGAVGVRPVVWRRDRWEPARAGEHRRINAGPALGGERDAIGHAGGDAITLPRHVAARLVATYLSTTRNATAAGALRWLSRALPLVPRAAADLLVPYAAPDADYGRTQLAVIAQARRGFSSVQIVVRGFDPYRVTAAACAWAARQLAARGPGPVGMRGPSELFRPAPALRDVAAAAGLTIEPSFGS